MNDGLRRGLQTEALLSKRSLQGASASTDVRLQHQVPTTLQKKDDHHLLSTSSGTIGLFS
jgi:hypothetical protein